MQNAIYSLELKYNNIPHPFVIKTLEDVGGMTDDPHRHNYYSVIWSTQATGKHIIDFKEYPIQPNHIFFVSPQQVHQVITDPHPRGFVILFTPEFLEKNSIREDFIANLRLFRNSDETPPLPLSEKMTISLKAFAEHMLLAFNSDDDLRFEALGAYLKLFLIECNGHCSLIPEGNTQTIEVGKTLVKQFKNIVENHYKTWHQVKDYAEELNVTPNYLNEVIKSAINISAKDYIQNRLMLEAKRMTLFTGKSSKEIGYDLGFDDPSHFSKFFKSVSGHSLQDFKGNISL